MLAVLCSLVLFWNLFKKIIAIDEDAIWTLLLLLMGIIDNLLLQQFLSTLKPTRKLEALNFFIFLRLHGLFSFVFIITLFFETDKRFI